MCRPARSQNGPHVGNVVADLLQVLLEIAVARFVLGEPRIAMFGDDPFAGCRAACCVERRHVLEERLDLDRAFLRHRDALLLVGERGRYVDLIKLAVEAKMRIAP